MTKSCPYCGVAIPNNCLTCPRCFKNIPREEEANNAKYREGAVEKEPTPKQKRTNKKSRMIFILLTVVPAFFGILGLAQIHRDYKDSLGYYFLLGGLLFFIPSFFLIFGVWDLGIFIGIFRIVAYVILTIIYLLIALAALLDAMFGSVFNIIRF